MADASGAEAELARAVSDPGYTPPTRALPALVAALATSGEPEALERAIARAGAPALDAALAAFERATRGTRAPLLGLLGRLATGSRDPRLFEALSRALDGSASEQRRAARALGKLGDPRAEAPLLACLGGAALPEQRSIVDALGLVGGEQARAALAALGGDDPDLARRRERALLLLERRALREAPGALHLRAALGRAWPMAFSCRRGLAELVAEEIASLGLGAPAGPRVRSPSRIDLRHGGDLEALLAVRTALAPALVIALDAAPGREPAARIAEALARPAVVAACSAWTEGVPRFRVAWSDGGHHRALSWALARELAQRTRALVNDSERALWTLHAPATGEGELMLAPRLSPDPRFGYRVREVRAASHPTLAAALARAAGVREDDVVWDPFVGSGLELVERAKLGRVRRLIGSDSDAGALGAARENLRAAGVDAELVCADARTYEPGPVSLILSNPPMGRRIARDGTLGELLTTVVARAARLLTPGGRLVWLSPLERVTERVARERGLVPKPGPSIDMGGFEARLQVLEKPLRA